MVLGAGQWTLRCERSRFDPLIVTYYFYFIFIILYYFLFIIFKLNLFLIDLFNFFCFCFWHDGIRIGRWGVLAGWPAVGIYVLFAGTVLYQLEKAGRLASGLNVGTEYHMTENGKMVKLGEIKEEKELGVYTTNNLKPSMQCTKAASKARSVLSMIRRHFKTIDAEELHILRDSYIIPHMEYCVQVWSQYLRKDIECLERVQISATKMVKGLRKMEYKRCCGD